MTTIHQKKLSNFTGDTNKSNTKRVLNEFFSTNPSKKIQKPLKRVTFSEKSMYKCETVITIKTKKHDGLGKRNEILSKYLNFRLRRKGIDIVKDLFGKNRQIDLQFLKLDCSNILKRFNDNVSKGKRFLVVLSHDGCHMKLVKQHIDYLKSYSIQNYLDYLSGK